jgi:hypothetical protein
MDSSSQSSVEQLQHTVSIAILYVAGKQAVLWLHEHVRVKNNIHIKGGLKSKNLCNEIITIKLQHLAEV